MIVRASFFRLCASGPFDTSPIKFNDSSPLDLDKNRILHFVVNVDLLSAGVPHQDLKESIDKFKNVTLKYFRDKEAGALNKMTILDLKKTVRSSNTICIY